MVLRAGLLQRLRQMRAQITLEALLLAAVGISLLLIASVAVQKLSGVQQDMHAFSLLKNHAQTIANTADEICILGEGNSRTVPLSQYAFELKTGADKKGIILQKDNMQTVAQTMCKIDVRGASFSKTAYLWYEDSQIVVCATPHS